MVSPEFGTRHEDTDDAVFRQYWAHASALRNWFVVYGLGGIALLFTQAEAVAGLSPSTKAQVIGGLMLTVIAQVVSAFLNKWTHWSAQWGEKLPTFKDTLRHRFAMGLSRRVWIDFALDLISLLSALFAIAALVSAVAASPQNVVDPNS